MKNSLHAFELQKLLFEEEPQRSVLLDFVSSGKAIYKANVYRNHSFELIEHTIGAYLDYAELQIQFEYSDYDDSLSFLNIDSESDFMIVWLDVNRYKTSLFVEFLEERLGFLKTIYRKPVLVVLCGGDEVLNLDNQFLQMGLDEIADELGTDYFDERLEKYSGTRLSSKACMKIAAKMGLQYIPALVKPSLKAIIVDLDNTLYEGVLGEDGIAEVRLTEGHVKLQESLVQLAKNGFLLCIASKNEIKDVHELFSVRKDFPLNWEDFSRVCASWNAKAESVNEICEALNIGPESLLFIDDNLGELVQMKEAYPDIHEILALPDAMVTDGILRTYPGIMKLDIKHEDSIRKSDLKANQERKKLQEEYSTENYLKALDAIITFNIDNEEQIDRISELSNKTNQFIFNYKRYAIGEVAERVQSDQYAICAVSLEDKLSDSGIIGVCVLEKMGQFAHLEECFVSCRALGRGLDETIVLGAVQCALNSLGVRDLKTSIIDGERNLPARNFYEKYFSDYNNRVEKFQYEMPEDIVTIRLQESDGRQ